MKQQAEAPQHGQRPLVGPRVLLPELQVQSGIKNIKSGSAHQEEAAGGGRGGRSGLGEPKLNSIDGFPVGSCDYHAVIRPRVACTSLTSMKLLVIFTSSAN